MGMLRAMLLCQMTLCLLAAATSAASTSVFTNGHTAPRDKASNNTEGQATPEEVVVAVVEETTPWEAVLSDASEINSAEQTTTDAIVADIEEVPNPVTEKNYEEIIESEGQKLDNSSVSSSDKEDQTKMNKTEEIHEQRTDEVADKDEETIMMNEQNDDTTPLRRENVAVSLVQPESENSPAVLSEFREQRQHIPEDPAEMEHDHNHDDHHWLEKHQENLSRQEDIEIEHIESGLEHEADGLNKHQKEAYEHELINREREDEIRRQELERQRQEEELRRLEEIRRQQELERIEREQQERNSLVNDAGPVIGQGRTNNIHDHFSESSGGIAMPSVTLTLVLVIGWLVKM